MENSPPGIQTIPRGVDLGAGVVFGTVGPKALVLILDGSAALAVAAAELTLALSTGFCEHETAASSRTPTMATDSLPAQVQVSAERVFRLFSPI
jgi:hypothetical protein